MKCYVKPSFNFIQLRTEEGIACNGSECKEEYGSWKGRGGRIGHGVRWGWGNLWPW
ncbi:MAG: hypothetical protein ACYDG2_06130 [Ruminiclostridium sp.]